MLKQFICQYTEFELVELIKQAIRAVNAEERPIKSNRDSPTLLDSTTFLSTKEVQLLLKCSAPTIIKLRREQKLQSKKIGGKYYYRAVDINDMLTPNRKRK